MWTWSWLLHVLDEVVKCQISTSPSEPRQEAAKESLVRKRSHSPVHLNKWVHIITLWYLFGEAIDCRVFFSDLYGLSKRSYSNHFRGVRLVLRPDPGCALLINNTERGSRVLHRGMQTSHTGYPQTPLHLWWKPGCLSSCLSEVRALWEFNSLDIRFKWHVFYPLKGFEWCGSDKLRFKCHWVSCQTLMCLFLSVPLKWLIKGVWWLFL